MSALTQMAFWYRASIGSLRRYKETIGNREALKYTHSAILEFDVCLVYTFLRYQLMPSQTHIQLPAKSKLYYKQAAYACNTF